MSQLLILRRLRIQRVAQAVAEEVEGEQGGGEEEGGEERSHGLESMRLAPSSMRIPHEL